VIPGQSRQKKPHPCHSPYIYHVKKFNEIIVTPATKYIRPPPLPTRSYFHILTCCQKMAPPTVQICLGMSSTNRQGSTVCPGFLCPEHDSPLELRRKSWALRKWTTIVKLLLESGKHIHEPQEPVWSPGSSGREQLTSPGQRGWAPTPLIDQRGEVYIQYHLRSSHVLAGPCSMQVISLWALVCPLLPLFCLSSFM
jgi:hypothetical protein